MDLLRSPLLHFLAGGAILFLGVRGVEHIAPPEIVRPGGDVVVTADDVARLRDDFAKETGIEPTAADEVALIERTIEEELLFREAVARGLDRNDRSIRHWLIEQMRSLTDDESSDEQTLYARAQALGLDRNDLVVRRILVQKMRLLAERAGEQDPGDWQLRDFYAVHGDDYRQPQQVTFWHLFLGSSRAANTEDAARVLDEIRRGAGEDPAAAARRGDPFPLPPHLVSQSQRQLEKVLGPSLAAEVLRARVGAWSGPFRSPHGWHLVWVEAREAGAAPPFEAVRGRVLEAWREETRRTRVAELLRELGARTSLRVASEAWQQRRNT